MSRHNYTTDLDEDDFEAYREEVDLVIRCPESQAFLREVRDALDALPNRLLIAGELVNCEGECCTLGAVGLKRGLDMSRLDPEEPEDVAKAFGIDPIIVREITYENDDAWGGISDEKRWKRIRTWVDRRIV